ncbi:MULTISPECIES: RNA polymerase sigma factor [Paenibacillus]|uniref:RNA polymerase sigma factor n=1 Tax=Paenibacillus TaxID=44249 RepID=UPI0004321D6F|nr:MULTISPECIES: sigma-70 family RNA polymerase sigma factor [Paenibacillus]CDN42317.1 hypothetical protein BN871_BD_00060 [Paenibacillus sp. P22]
MEETGVRPGLEAYIPGLRRRCLRLAGAGWDAQDLEQEVLAKLHRLQLREPERRLTQAYVNRMAANAWIDICRSRSSRGEQAGVEYEEELHAPRASGGPDEALRIRMLLEQLSGRLNPRQMAMILLMDVFRFTADETSRLLRLTPGAVREGHRRARQRLQALAREEQAVQEQAVQQQAAQEQAVQQQAAQEQAAQEQAAQEQAVQEQAVQERGGPTRRRKSVEPLPPRIFERFLDAFRRGDAEGICSAYLSIASHGVQVDKVEAGGRRISFAFRDPSGHLIQLVQDLD